jgi:hypothetical protein
MNFEGLKETTVGIDEGGKWEYEGLGYNASTGVFYVGEEQVQAVEIIPFALRQCKEVLDGFGVTHRYPVRTAKAKMVEGDITYRLQLICQHNGDLYTFGGRAYTTRASFVNPEKGQWRSDKIPTGIWVELMNHIKAIKAENGAQTAPCAWSMTLKSGKEFTAGTGKNTSKARPIVLDGKFEFIGAVEANANAELYETEDLEGWRVEWEKKTETVAATDETEVYEDDIDEIPF